MNLLERYIFKRAFFAFFAVLIALSGVIWIVQALTKVDVFSTNGQSLFTYFSITLLAIPGLLLAVIPIALLISSTNTVNALNTNSELVIVSAAGASSKVIAKPFLVLAFLCTLATGFVGHFGMPWCLSKIKHITSQMNADLISIIIKEGEFNKIEDGLTFHVAKRNNDGTLSGILVSDEREEDKENLYIAKTGVILKKDENNLLQLLDGEIHQKDTGSGESSIIKFTSYVIDVSAFGGPKTVGLKRPKERYTTDLFDVDPDDDYFKKRPNSFAVEIHERFSEMLWPFANVLIILAFAGNAKSSRQGHGYSLFVAAILLVALRASSFTAQNAANANPNNAYLMYVIPIIAMLFGAYWVLSNRLVEMPKILQPYADWIADRHQKNLKAISDAHIFVRRKLSGT